MPFLSSSSLDRPVATANGGADSELNNKPQVRQFRKYFSTSMKRIKRQLSTALSSESDKSSGGGSATVSKKNHHHHHHRLAQLGRSGTLDPNDDQSLGIKDDRRRSSSVAYLESTRPNFLPLQTPLQHQPSCTLAPVQHARSQTALNRDSQSAHGSLQHLTTDIQQHYHYLRTPSSTDFQSRSSNSNSSVDDDPLVFEMQKRILKAKAEGSTVSVVNGSLFIDYKYVGRLPPGCIV